MASLCIFACRTLRGSNNFRVGNLTFRRKHNELLGLIQDANAIAQKCLLCVVSEGDELMACLGLFPLAFQMDGMFLTSTLWFGCKLFIVKTCTIAVFQWWLEYSHQPAMLQRRFLLDDNCVVRLAWRTWLAQNQIRRMHGDKEIFASWGNVTNRENLSENVKLVDTPALNIGRISCPQVWRFHTFNLSWVQINNPLVLIVTGRCAICKINLCVKQAGTVIFPPGTTRTLQPFADSWEIVKSFPVVWRVSWTVAHTIELWTMAFCLVLMHWICIRICCRSKMKSTMYGLAVHPSREIFVHPYFHTVCQAKWWIYNKVYKARIAYKEG